MALLGAILSAGYRDAIGARWGAAREGIAGAVAGTHSPELIRAAQDAFVEGWQRAMWAGVGVMAALLLYLLRPRRGR